ncbi:MAG: sugar ABC transporter ATP-binding protein [Candidatus Hydrogenedentes bacterium]|nr:sugar ABC transporter ATP-binding protein [Candidatus Hydrogenedentota bacterium]MBI3118744.1 sugar ABC transporter ATP-binding protein [Candidatus Hydrogenedentota bacterium]
MSDMIERAPASTFVLEMRDITKRFPGVLALDKTHLELRRGEVHCLLGENGAGKSTMMKILAGALKMDSGEILLDGELVDIQSPHHAQELGISMIYQEFNLSPFLSVAENIFLGREPRLGRTPFIDWRRMYREAEEILAQIRVGLDVRRPVNTLSVAQQQMVEIAKAISVNARIIVMDEPSATLTDHELRALFDLIKTLRRQEIGLIYISHRLEEIFEIGTRVTVMRDGQTVATNNVYDLTRDKIIQMMVGRELKDEFPKEQFERGEERLRVAGLSRKGFFEDVSFSLYKGEIVGLTGLVGAGRTEVARAIFGADKKDTGTISLDGKAITVHSPQDAIWHGIGLLTEDRKSQGLVLGMTVRENATLANLSALVWGPFVSRKKERAVALKYVDELRIKTPSIEQVAQNLSGGNQQKVVLAKWLFTDSKVLIFDEPTRGIDVGAKVEIYKLMNELVRRGVAVLMISSELPEVLGMCDRILVMHEGRLAGELPRAAATQERIMQLATGERLAAV